ncbi:MAG: tetratricopeptide repeat protein [Thermoplasmatota archaeon]
MGLFGSRREVGELNEKVADTLEKAYLAYRRGDYETSSRKFRLALDYLMVENDLHTQVHITEALVVDIAEIFNMTVQSYNNIGSFDESVSLIESAEKKFKNRRRVLLMKANVYAAKGERSSELEIYNTLLKIDKKDIPIYIKKAELLKKLGKADESELREILNKSAKYQKASDIQGCVKLAAAYRTILSDHGASQYVLDRISTKRPPKEMLLEQAEIYIQGGEVEKAIATLEVILEKDKGFIEAISVLVKAYQMHGDYQKARDVCELGLKLDPSNPALLRSYRELSGDAGIIKRLKAEETYM